MRRRMRFLTEIGLAFILVAQLLVQPAAAYRQGNADVMCDNQAHENMEEVTRAAGASNGNLLKTVTGVIAQNPLRQRDENLNCDGELFGTGVTVFFVNGSGQLTGRYVHAGWDRYDPGFTRDGHIWEGWNGSIWHGGSCAGGCLDQFPRAFYSSTCKYKVNLVSGTTDWKAWVSCDGDPYVLLSTFVSTGYTRGVATTTTYRRGGVSTGMTDSFSQLQYRNANDVWTDWPRNVNYLDNASNWHAANIYPQVYSVIKD